jgi:hypothetical protein
MSGNGNVYAKRVITGEQYLPPDLVPYSISDTDVLSNLVRIIPQNISPLTITTQPPYQSDFSQDQIDENEPNHL